MTAEEYESGMQAYANQRSALRAQSEALHVQALELRATWREQWAENLGVRVIGTDVYYYLDDGSRQRMGRLKKGRDGERVAWWGYSTKTHEVTSSELFSFKTTTKVEPITVYSKRHKSSAVLGLMRIWGLPIPPETAADKHFARD